MVDSGTSSLPSPSASQSARSTPTADTAARDADTAVHVDSDSEDRMRDDPASEDELDSGEEAERIADLATASATTSTSPGRPSRTSRPSSNSRPSKASRLSLEAGSSSYKQNAGMRLLGGAKKGALRSGAGGFNESQVLDKEYEKLAFDPFHEQDVAEAASVLQSQIGAV